jgi:RsiW-degrading membrane proteinase PrsW (M82 family)
MTTAARLTWLWILIIGVGLYLLVRHTLIATGDPNYLPALILLGAAVVPVSFVAFVSERQLPYDVSSGLLVIVALVGGVIGTVVAGTLEYRTLTDLGVLPLFWVAVFEEAAKLIAPAAVLFFTQHRRHPADGLLLGVAAGAGFAVLETMGYAFVVLIQSNGNIGAVEGVLLVRGLLSPAAHMAWTGLTAAALWRMTSRDGSGAFAGIRFAVVFLVAVILHATWDSIDTETGYAVLAAVSLVLLFGTVHGLRQAATQSLRGRIPRAVFR